MKDFYLDASNSQNRIFEEYKKYGSLVIAFDFDDTVYDFHQKGRNYSSVIDLLKELALINCHLICWTAREDLDVVENYLISNNIPFHQINTNPSFHTSSSKKIYANAYLDDRAGLAQTYKELFTLVNLIKNESITLN